MKRLHLCFLLAVFSLFVLGCSEDSASVVQNENGSDLPPQQGSEIPSDSCSGDLVDEPEIPSDSSNGDIVEKTEIPSDSSSEILENKPFEEAFIIAPKADSLNVTDSERTFLDSLSKEYPEKYAIDEIDGMTLFINYDAQYNFYSEEERSYVSAGAGTDTTCSVDLYKQEKGLVRRLSAYDGWRSLESTILVIPSEDIPAIVYLAHGEIGSGVEKVKALFKSECEAALGSFYDYVEYDVVAVGCAVKNFDNETIQTLMEKQGRLCENQYKKK